MKVVQKITRMVLVTAFAILFTGCNAYQKQYQESLDKSCDVKSQIATQRQNSTKLVQDGGIRTHFSGGNVYRSGITPVWLSMSVNIRANRLPLSLLMTKILPANSVGVQYVDGADRDAPVTVNYAGSIAGALDKIAAQMGYAYDIENGMLTWSPYVTKTFDVSFMPGSSQYLMGQKQGDTMLNVSSGSSNTATGQNSDSQFSSLEGNLSVWNDLQKSIKEMLSPDGRVMVSESTTTVTVRDHPQNIQAVADYLASMNRDLSKEVLLQVHVYQVSLDKNFNFGIDWNIAYNTAARIGFGNGDMSQPVAIDSMAGNNPGGPQFPTLLPGHSAPAGISSGMPGISAGVLTGPFANTQVLINAISQQGTVSNITNPQVVTLNNQVAQIDISQQTTYLASSTTTLTAGATGTSSGFAQTTLNPGVVNSGFKLYILPKIQNGNVYLQISSELSTLDRLRTVSSQGATIQLPSISGKHFNLRSMVPNRSTLIIGGFKSVDSVAGQASQFGILGGKGADQKNVETILFITPTVLGNNS